MTETLANAPPTGGPPPADAPPQARATLLFVDDEPSILSALRRLFRPLGYKVLMAEGGAAGLALLETEPVDVVISDMRMPGMDGVQFLEQVRQRWPDVVRVLLTGYADIGSTIGAINRGEIHRYISKPWDDQQIMLSVTEGLERQRLQRENLGLITLTQAQNAELQVANEQLKTASDELQRSSRKLETANGELAKLNDELEQRVAERTRELEEVVEKLAEANNRMEQANEKLAAANEQLEENFQLSMTVFGGLLEMRDGNVAGHGQKVAEMARRTAQKMGLNGVEEGDIQNAGLLHEIGMIGLPDTLIGKTVSLMTGEEFALYKQHPVMAQHALMPLGRLRQSAVIIRSQHERVDGSGFPDGLSGFEVPLGSQIINIASTFLSLISGHLAEKVYSTEAAMALLRETAGHHHDPEVVEAFAQVVTDMAVELAADQEVEPDKIAPGMVLTRPVLSPHGSVLLPVGFAFTTPVIRQVHEFIRKNGLTLTFFVKKNDGKPGSGRR